MRKSFLHRIISLLLLSAIVIQVAADAAIAVQADDSPTFIESGYSESSSKVVWFDTNNSIDHNGHLNLSVSLTVGSKTINVNPTWNAGNGKYSYSLTVDDLKNLGINLSEAELNTLSTELSPVTIEASTDNNLLFSLTAKVSKFIAPASQNDNIIAEFSLGEIEITGTNYVPQTPSAEIQDYILGTSLDEGGNEITTLYPLTEVKFHFDIRSGNDSEENILKEAMKSAVKIQMLLKDSLTSRDEDIDVNDAGWVEDPLDDEVDYFEKYFGISSKEILDSLVKSTTEEHTYSLLMPLYDINKKYITYALNTEDNKNIPISGTDDYYEIEHDNTVVPGHNTHIDVTYEDGTMILIKAGDSDFLATKVWEDDGKQVRPTVTYTLWRYSTKGGDYTTASQTEIPTLVDGKVEWTTTAQTIDNTKDVVEILLPEYLEKYDTDGFPYVYFIREALPGGSGYEKIYGAVGEGMDGLSNITDTLPESYPQDKRISSDTSIYDNGTITNRRSERHSVSVSKDWNAAYYQDNLEDISVELELYAKHKNVEDGDTTAFLVDTVTLSGFDALHTSQSASVAIDRFDAHGHEIEYYWVEKAISQGGKEVEIGAIQGEETRYTLPLNENTMDSESYSAESDEYFVAEYTQTGEYSATFSNNLVGDTEYWVKKTWGAGLDLEDVDVQLFVIDEYGTVKPYKDENGQNAIYTISSEEPSYTGSIEEGWQTAWIKAFKDLPKYDADGNRYSYFAKEITTGNWLSSMIYGHNVDEDDAKEANSVLITNMPVDNSRHINIRKIWLDDSATTDRTTVYVNVYAHFEIDDEEQFILLYGSEPATADKEAVEGLISSDAVELSRIDEWIKRDVNVTVFQDAEGKLTLEQVEGSELYEGDMVIKEVKLGTNPVDTVNTTLAGYPTVQNGETKYAVIYSSKNEQGEVIKSKEYTDITDSDGFYNVSNLRIGTTDISVKKIWQDDETVDRSKFISTFTVTCVEDPSKVYNVNNLGYSKVSAVVSSDQKQPLLDKEGNHISNVLTINTADNESEVNFYNLPLYDDNGKILHYTVQETLVCTDDSIKGSYAISSGGVSYGSLTNGSIAATQTITNTFQQYTDISFDLLWLDEYRIKTNKRPDIFLFLYKTIYLYNNDGTPVLDENGKHKTKIVKHDFIEHVWDPKSNEKNTEDWWRYTFTNLPEYDSHGKKIYYFGSLHTHANLGVLDYIDTQFAPGNDVNEYEDYLADTISTVTNQDGDYIVTHDKNSGIVGEFTTDGSTSWVLESGNTFVMQLKEDLSVVGHKVWQKIPYGFPVADLPPVSFTISREVVFADETVNDEEENQIVAAIFNLESPTLEYSFKLKYYGINDENGNYIDPDTEILDIDGKTKIKAIDAWTRITGLPEDLYGELLPKYNGKGEMYRYNITEAVLDEKDGKLDIAYTDVNQSIIGNQIVNTFNTTETNSAQISVNKNWKVNGEDKEDDVFPPQVDILLYRFYKIDSDNKYSTPTYVGGRTMDVNEMKNDVTQVFGEELIYAPNGNPFIYFIAEKKVDGYNYKPDDVNYQYPLMTISSNATFIDKESGTNGWPLPVANEDYWYSEPFVLFNGNVEADQVEMGIDNDYTALPQVETYGEKQWLDFDNAFNTRPEKLQVEIYRTSKSLKTPEMVATVSLQRDSTIVLVDQEEGINISSAAANNKIEGKIVRTDGKWSFTVSNLDGIAPNGEEWQYSMKEVEYPDHYKPSNKGTFNADGVVVNDIYTSITAEKKWADVNPGISYPEVKVKLQVSYDEGVNWSDAATGDFGQVLGTNYEYVKTLKYQNSQNSWKAFYSLLPNGYVPDGKSTDDYVEFQYRVLETEIGGVEVLYNGTDVTANPVGQTGDGKYTVSIDKGIVTNTPITTKLSVQKVWDDQDDKYSLRKYKSNKNWTVSYHIYREFLNSENVLVEQVYCPDGVTPYVLTIEGASGTNNATTTLDHLPAYSPDGAVYRYYVVELNPNGTEIKNNRYYGSYDVKYDHSGTTGDGFESVVTNKLITTDLLVTKDWSDYDDLKNIRPDNLVLDLYQQVNSSKAQNITAIYKDALVWDIQDNTWMAGFYDLPKYDHNSVLYKYTVTEAQQSGYKKPLITKDAFTAQDEYQTTSVVNTINEMYIDKFVYDREAKSITNEEMFPSKLIFKSNEKIYNTLTGTTQTVWLEWSKTEAGEMYIIKLGDNYYSASLWTYDTADDRVKIIGLPDGKYTLAEETIIQDGYCASALNSQFELKNGTIVENSDYLSYNSTSNLLSVANSPFTFVFEKHATTDGKTVGMPLQGVKFGLQKFNGSEWVDIETDQSLESDADGKVTLESLENGEAIFVVSKEQRNSQKYRVVELEAPMGYYLPGERPFIEFWFDVNGKPQYHNGKDTVNQFTILNRAFESATLATGGEGRYSIYFAGSTIMLATCLFWVYTKKKKTGNENN